MIWAPFTNMVSLQSQHGHVIMNITKCGMKLLIHSQTSTVECSATKGQLHRLTPGPRDCPATSEAILKCAHHSDVIMGAMASQITGVSIVYSAVCSRADQRKHQSSASLAFVRRIYQWLVDSPHKGSVTRMWYVYSHLFPHIFDVQKTINRLFYLFCYRVQGNVKCISISGNDLSG